MFFAGKIPSVRFLLMFPAFCDPTGSSRTPLEKLSACGESRRLRKLAAFRCGSACVHSRRSTCTSPFQCISASRSLLTCQPAGSWPATCCRLLSVVVESLVVWQFIGHVVGCHIFTLKFSVFFFSFVLSYILIYLNFHSPINDEKVYFCTSV